MSRLLTSGEIAAFLGRHAVTAAIVPPWGIIFVEGDRKTVVFKKVDGSLIFSDTSDLTIGHLEGQFPNGVGNSNLTVQEGQMVVASLPAIIQNAIKETVASVSEGVAAGVNFTGGVVVAAAAGAGQGAFAGSGAGTFVLLVGVGLAVFIAWKLRVV